MHLVAMLEKWTGTPIPKVYYPLLKAAYVRKYNIMRLRNTCSYLMYTLALLSGCAPLGTRPSDTDIERFAASKNYNAEKNQFENRLPGVMEAMNNRIYSLDSFKAWLDGPEQGRPPQLLPSHQPNISAFSAKDESLKIIWLGHSSFLLNMDGSIILVDPVFSQAASPISLFVRRFQDPPIPLQALPPIDYILISHDHYDHLDMETIEFFIERETHFVVPLGVGNHLTGWGIPAERVTENDWWETASFADVTFIAAPAQHFSGRDGIHPNETLWASWIVQSAHHIIYFSGDSGYDTHFQTIGERYGPFDVVFLDSGQYNERWREVHMFPREAMQAARDLRAQFHFPVHWGMFELALHDWDDPIRRLAKLRDEHSVPQLTPQLGQVVQIPGDVPDQAWWE